MEYGTIYIKRFGDASNDNRHLIWNGAMDVNYTKYSIKETDFRIKTATFTSPDFYDLTEGQYAILISSKYHENFAGVLLDVTYDEKTGLYEYQCQDWSRKYMSKDEIILNNCKIYNVLLHLLSQGGISASKPTKQQKANLKGITSGLRAKGLYDQSLYDGNVYKGNPFNQSLSAIIRDKSIIETIRSIVFGSLGYFDVYFNDGGVLQIEPISKTDWENTGLVLSDGGYTERKFKFSTTNAITEVTVNGSDLSVGNNISMKDLTGLNLSAFFGRVGTSASVPNQTTAVKKTSSSNKSKSKSKSKTTTAKKTSSNKNKYGNPIMNKPKKVWINADNGSNGMKNALAKLLKKNGWTVHTGATYSNAHYTDYFKVPKNYTYITVYNGFCAGTIREAYSSTIQNTLKKKNVQLVVVFDTAGWTNPRGMKPYRYGDFSHYSVHRAWDDNFSSGDPSIKNVGNYFKKHKAVYCANPTASGVMKQFNAGGYFKYKGIKV